MLKKRKLKLFSVPNVIGLAGVLMALLFLFMVRTLFRADLPLTAVDLPYAAHTKRIPCVRREDAIVIIIWKDGTLFFRNNKVNPDQLPALIREQLGKGAEKKAYIQADARAKYGSVVEVIDAVHASGLENVAFLTWDKQIDDQQIPELRIDPY